jgi:hypothetical protein
MNNQQEGQQWRELRRRFLTGGGNGVNVAVANAVSLHEVTFTIREPDTDYGVSVMPSWDTTVYVTDKLTTGFTARFGSASGATDTLDYSIYRQ